ncbi:hypothetical protein ACFWFI_02945 [Streptomyces sp. NPDC060209]|uniref:hypothetical protein n=1 Tax=Streptomyces sp. NPDC060209 TaxID=3347073 RepID=UPI00365D5FF0
MLDRYRAAKYLVWARNLLAPASWRVKWADVQANQGSPMSVPSGLANALVIVADNTVHLAINTAALTGGGDAMTQSEAVSHPLFAGRGGVKDDSDPLAVRLGVDGRRPERRRRHGKYPKRPFASRTMPPMANR